MIHLRRCREILGSDCALTDEQIELLRDQLVAFANIALDARLLELRNGTTSALDATVSLIPEEHVEIFERASIMEFDGGMPRAQADESALRDYAWMRRDSGRVN